MRNSAPSPASSPTPFSRPTALSRLDDDGRREYWSALALRHTSGLGLLSICRLLKTFGSAWGAIQNRRRWEGEGIPSATVQTFDNEYWRKNARPEWEAARQLNGHVILWTDDRYPERLRELDDAPALLYALGDISLLSAPSVAVVGSRNASRAALDFTSSLSEGLSEAGIAVVSGLAFGVDACAHLAALRGPGRTIAVLGGGIDVPYPARHITLYKKIAEQGLIISEAAPGSPCHKGTFPRRNRIVSGIALGVLVTEAAHTKSGSLITARLAAEQGRSVYVPSPDALRGPYAEGSKALLMDGARPVWQAGDILADLHPHLRYALARQSAPFVLPTAHKSIPSPSSELTRQVQSLSLEKSDNGKPSAPLNEAPARVEASPDEQVLLELLKQGPLSPDDLLLAAQDQDADWTAPRLLSTLMIMEVRKLTRRRSDSRYEVLP